MKILIAILATAFYIGSSHATEKPSHQNIHVVTHSSGGSTASSGPVSVFSSPSATAVGGNGGGGGAGGLGGAGGAGGNSSSQGGQGGAATGSNSLDLNSRTVPSVVAPGLTTTLTDTCMGSVSGGLSLIGGAISLGSTKVDEECVNRLNARELRSMGHASAAKELMCMNEKVREAYRRAKQPCYEPPVPVVAQPEITDPYVRIRMGLAPLSETK